MSEFKSRRSAGDPECVQIWNAAHANGFRVQLSRFEYVNSRTIDCHRALHEVYARSGEAGVWRTLRALRVAFEQENGSMLPQSLTHSLIKGFGQYMRRNPEVHPDAVGATVRAAGVTPVRVIALAHECYGKNKKDGGTNRETKSVHTAVMATMEGWNWKGAIIVVVKATQKRPRKKYVSAY